MQHRRVADADGVVDAVELQRPRSSPDGPALVQAGMRVAVAPAEAPSLRLAVASAAVSARAALVELPVPRQPRLGRRSRGAFMFPAMSVADRAVFQSRRSSIWPFQKKLPSARPTWKVAATSGTAVVVVAVPSATPLR